MSQSAFAGYGLEAVRILSLTPVSGGRNPLSLDMGWKILNKYYGQDVKPSQSAFAGYGLEEFDQKCTPWCF